MKFRYRLLSVILAACALFLVLFYAGSSILLPERGESPLFRLNRTTVKLWYDDDTLTDYLQKQAVAFNETNGRIRVEPTYVSGVEYLEAINEASIEGENFPDLFLLTNDALEKSYLAGLATEVDQPDVIQDTESYSDAAIRSVTYHDKIVAYPFYMDTSALLYNKTYLQDYAQAVLEAEIDAESGQEATQALEDGDILPEEGGEQAEITYDISQERIAQEMKELLPATISDLLVFAENYNAPDDVEAVFKWDVSDLFFDYFVIGDYVKLGGEAGDDPTMLDLYNSDAIACMKVFRNLNQFFAIDAEETDYDGLMQDFLDGKIVFTLATTDALKQIEDAKSSGSCSFDFGVTTMPALTQDYGTRPLSITDCLCVNGYSEHAEEANQVARYLLAGDPAELWQQTGKVSAHRATSKDTDENLRAFQTVYGTSVPMPKMIATSNFWVQMEITFAKIWNGEDPNARLKELAEQMLTQVNGESVSLEAIPDPAEVEIEIESAEE